MDADHRMLLAAGAVVIGLPLVTFILVELARAAGARRPQVAAFLRILHNLVVPVAAVWVILAWIAELPNDGLAMRLTDTAFALAVVYAALSLMQLLLFSFAEVARRAPKLLVDLVRLMLVAFGASVVVSDVWGVDLGNLVAALGVGSIVLGLALQNVIGGLVGGILLVSFRPFQIGDLVRYGDKIARVAQLDWRAVTLEASGERILVPTSELSGKGITIVGPPGSPRVAEVAVAVGIDQPPEAVRAALLAAAAEIPQLTRPGAAGCMVTGYADGMVQYLVTLPLAAPLTLGGARHELLSRFWYVAQRQGIALQPPAEPLTAEQQAAQAEATLQARITALASCGALVRPDILLRDLAMTARRERYRPGEAVLAQGQARADLLVVEAGEAMVTVLQGDAPALVERLGAGDLHVTHATFRGDPSPVRVEASGDLSVIALPVAAVGDLLARNPALARDIEAVLEARAEALAKVRKGEGRLRAVA